MFQHFEPMEYCYNNCFSVLIYNSNICVNSELILVNWLLSSFGVMFAYLFVCLVICVWMPDIVNFTFLDTGYVCIFKNILELYSGMLSYLDTV